MTLTSDIDLVNALRGSRLLEPDQLQRVEGRLRRRPGDARSLARVLVERGWLTAYQVNQLLLGRGADLILGDYTLLEPLGEGSMGSIFKARHRKSGQIVALKLVRKDRLTNPQALARFQREMRALARLDHPNIVRALDADQAGDTLFFTMEYVDGTDLSKMVKQTGPLPVWLACDYVRQAALGLQHAFEEGLVHRDVKPSNLMVTAPFVAAGGPPAAATTTGGPPVATRGTTGGPPVATRGIVKVLDLGLARLGGALAEEGPGPALTKLQTVIGTPDYISPDQARDARSVDVRGDLYSLGCTFYFLLTGQPPFPGGTAVDKLMRHCSEPPTSVNQARRQRLAERLAAGQPTPADEKVPPEVAAVVSRLLAKEPEDRYQTPAELAGVLTALLPADIPAPAPLPPPSPESDEAAPSTEGEAVSVDSLETAGLGALPPADEYVSPAVPKGLALWLAILGAGLFLLLVLLVLALAGRHGPPPPHRTSRLATPGPAATMTALPRRPAGLRPAFAE